ncbi:MAG: hypothetical protein U5P10_14690 [Spirochaetia bacterium]|nr:hypothetical protein [Spirochaetia bacterium]
MRTLLTIVLLFGFAGGGLFAQADAQGRGFMFQIGLGAAEIEWPQGLKELMDYAEGQPDIDRVKVHLNLGLGAAVSENLYLLGSLQGYGDRLEDSYGDYVQINAYLFGLGLRWYPFVAGLVLGGDIGAARLVAMGSGVESNASEWGNGLGFTAGYDFGGRPTGVSLILGLRFDGMSVEGESVGTAALFLNLAFK